jgi:uncharacterized RDD family membrane protein YckC
MASPPIDTQLTPATAITPIAGFWRRLVAFLVDLLILGAPTLVFGLALFRWAASLGEGGRLIGFFVALLYFGLLNSHIGGGQTPGKRLLGIRVIRRDGKALSTMRSILRFLVIAVPYFLNGLWFNGDTAPTDLLQYLLFALLIFVVFGGLGAIAYLFVFNQRTRQSLHDLAAGSFVVRGSPTVVPDGLSIARLHLIIVGCWLALIMPGFAIYAMHDYSVRETLQPRDELRVTIKKQLGLRQVKMEMGIRSVITLRGASTTSFLQVDAWPDDKIDDLNALLPSIASIVLDRLPDLLGNQLLIVQAHRKFDLGIAAWTNSYREAHDAAAWREKLGRRGAPSTSI